MTAVGKYDATLNEILREHTGLGGELKFVNTVFSFMARHSKLFLAPNVDEQVAAVAKKHSRNARKARKQQRRQQQNGTPAPSSASASTSAAPSKPSPSTPLVAESKKTNTESLDSADEPMKIEVLTDDEDETPTAAELHRKSQPPPTSTSTSTAATSGDTSMTDVPELNMDDDGDAPPLGNGGTTDKYVWTQTLEDLEVSFKVAESVRGEDLTIKFTPSRLYVGIRGQQPLIDAEYPKESVPGECQWSLATDAQGKTLTVEIGKKDKMGWWSCVVNGDPEIDVQKIRPGESKIDNLDNETQRMVKKMMFDNQQKMMGKPTSDDARKMKALESFKAQHPEFDFTNAKMS